jgi:cell division initiation protein
MTPRDLRNMRFNQRCGYDPHEVRRSWAVAEHARALSENERLQRGPRAAQPYRTPTRGKAAQEALRAQRVADEIVSTARREAQLLVKEAELTGDKIVDQALEQSTHIESKIAELRTARREIQLRFRNTLDLLGRILEADMTEEEPRGATLHSLPRKRK